MVTIYEINGMVETLLTVVDDININSVLRTVLNRAIRPYQLQAKRNREELKYDITEIKTAIINAIDEAQILAQAAKVLDKQTPPPTISIISLIQSELSTWV